MEIIFVLTHLVMLICLLIILYIASTTRRSEAWNVKKTKNKISAKKPIQVVNDTVYESAPNFQTAFSK